MRLLIIGASSFLARQFHRWRAGQDLPCDAVHHGDISGPEDLSGYDVIVNFALDPACKTTPLDDALDYEAHIARLCATTQAHLVMLSTRMVYPEGSRWLAREDDPGAVGDTIYGTNKARTEGFIRDLMGERATILRLANIAGFEYPEPGRRSFLAMVLRTLREEQVIRYDMPADLKRDFLPVEAFCDLLDTVVNARPGGTFNAGSGVALPVGDLADLVTAGFGAGRLEVIDTGKTDEFVLDMTKTRTLWPRVPDEGEVRDALKQLGQRLAAMQRPDLRGPATPSR